jgi:hypothetical protein
MKTIEVRTLPHAKQRYDTIGDYEEVDNGRAVAFRISAMPDWRSEAAVLIHELVEYLLVKRARIKLEDIDFFDIDFESRRGIDFMDTGQEAGDDPAAPYFKQHQFATIIERLFVRELGLTWQEHEDNCNGTATVGLRPRRPTRSPGGAGRADGGLAERSGGILRDDPGPQPPGPARVPLEGDRSDPVDADRESAG